jgi:signal transduction histidine kinase
MTAILEQTQPTLTTQRRARFVVRGLRTVVACVVIALMLTGLTHSTFLINLVHSLCIGLSCWLAIDLGRVPLARWQHRNAPADSPEAQSQWPGWPLMLVVIVIGTAIGFSIGNELARWITGVGSPGFYRGSWLQGIALLAGTLIPSVVITYFYYSRERMAAQEAMVQTAQRQAAENQLKLLESQLEPHMLFNTLANLRVLIGMDPARAQLMLDQLIAFLRATLGASRVSRHPLSAEFARLADYLALMKVRMGERLQSAFELPAELASVAIPPLLLQPLVENCIKHGLEPAVAGGRVDMRAARDGAMLVLTVRDTGAGLSNHAIEGTKFGLVQVRERLAALYGTHASLTLADAADAEGGTLAIVRLPITESPTP